MSAYDLFGGACRTAGGNKGSYDERWDLTPNQCRQRCDERAADCVAFELMMVGSFELCKQHKDPITKVMPVAGASCSVKARSHAPGAVPLGGGGGPRRHHAPRSSAETGLRLY